MAGATNTTSKTNERLVALETDLGGLRGDFHLFRDEVRSQLGAISRNLTDQATSRQWSLGSTLGVVGALATWSGLLVAGVWFMVDMGSEPTRVRQSMLIEDYKDHKDNHGHPKMVADLSRLEARLAAEALATDQQDSRLVRLEEWYNGHGREMDVKVAVVEGDVKAMEQRVIAAEKHLSGPDGQRFNQEDIKPYAMAIATLEERVHQMTANRFTRTDGEKLRDDNEAKLARLREIIDERIDKLEDKAYAGNGRVSAVEANAERTENEQSARRNAVLKAGKLEE